MSSILEVRDLHVSFPVTRSLLGKTLESVQAVSGVSFSLEKGETLGLVGESGCGKSTLGRAILRLSNPNRGDVRFMGKDLLAASSKELRELRRDMQLIFQDPFSSLNPRMTVSDIIAEPFKIHGVKKGSDLNKEIGHLLDYVGLPRTALSRLPHQFSGGQRQRIGIARAIALRPKLIIADEPVSALDVSIQSQILNLLADLRAEFGLSYIFIAHDLAVVEHISDMIAVMYLGRIVEYAPAKMIYASPRHPYTQALIKSIPEPEVQVRKSIRAKELIKGDVPSPIAPPPGCHLHPRCPKATDICKRVVPVLEVKDPAQPKHVVACHHAND